MAALQDGEIRDARVVGFLPARRVVLELSGQLFVAWTNLPLVRDSRVRVRIEAHGHGLRLRVVDESSAPKRPNVDDLDALIERIGSRLGIAVDPTLTVSIVEQIKALHAPLREGFTSLDALEDLVHDALRAHARNLEPSLEAWALMRATANSRLGVGIARLVDALRALAAFEPALIEDAEALEDFFVDLEQPLTRERLESGITRCGCPVQALDTESSRELGTFPTRMGVQPEDANLEDCLRQVRARLDTRGEPSAWPRQVHRQVERAGAWVRRLAEILAATRVQNADVPQAPDHVAHFQIPARSAGRHGTLYVFRSPQSIFLWTDVPTPTAAGGFVTLVNAPSSTSRGSPNTPAADAVSAGATEAANRAPRTQPSRPSTHPSPRDSTPAHSSK